MKILLGLTLLLNLYNTITAVNVYEKKNGKYIHWQGEIFGIHNKYRKMHCVPKLKPIQKIAVTAQKTSKLLCTQKELTHSGNKLYGENLFKAIFPKNFTVDRHIMVDNAVKAWYSENKFYNYDNPVDNKKSLHFTQLIWKNTVEFGCGLTECVFDNHKVIVIACNYSPPGNYRGQFKENVPKPCK